MGLRHKLSNLDKETKKACCLACGEVTVVFNGGRYKCPNKYKEIKAKWVEARRIKRGSSSNRHKLSNKNLELKIACCSICGPVSIRFKQNARGAQTAYCSNKIKQYNGKRKGKRKSDWIKKIEITKDELDKHTRATHCEICGKQPDKSLHLDHCHKTNNFRGSLCLKCNVALGLLDDSKDSLINAIAYLEKAESR